MADLQLTAVKCSSSIREQPGLPGCFAHQGVVCWPQALPRTRLRRPRPAAATAGRTPGAAGRGPATAGPGCRRQAPLTPQPTGATQRSGPSPAGGQVDPMRQTDIVAGQPCYHVRHAAARASFNAHDLSCLLCLVHHDKCSLPYRDVWWGSHRPLLLTHSLRARRAAVAAAGGGRALLARAPRGHGGPGRAAGRGSGRERRPRGRWRAPRRGRAARLGPGNVHRRSARDTSMGGP